MSTSMTDSLVLTAAAATEKLTQLELVARAICDCCGFEEECTKEYIERIREIYKGKWLCGLCAEAVKHEEAMRFKHEKRLISSEEALSLHLSFCKTFQSSPSPPPNPTVNLIIAMRQILRRSLDSPRFMRSVPCSPTKEPPVAGLARSGSCIPRLSLVEEGSGQ